MVATITVNMPPLIWGMQNIGSVMTKRLWYSVTEKKLYKISMYFHSNSHKGGNEIRELGRNDGGISYENSLLLCIF